MVVSFALSEELVGGWLSCNFMVPAQVSSHLSGAFDGHHRPYVVNLKLCHDLWDVFLWFWARGGPQKCGSWYVLGFFCLEHFLKWVVKCFQSGKATLDIYIDPYQNSV